MNDAKNNAELTDALEQTKDSTTGGDEANKKAKDAAAVKELVENQADAKTKEI